MIGLVSDKNGLGAVRTVGVDAFWCSYLNWFTVLVCNAMIGAPVWYRLFQWLIIFRFFKEILLNNLGPHFQKNTFITHGMQLKIQNAFKVFLSIFNVVLVVPIECYSCGWQSAVESSLFHQVKSNFHFWQVKSNLYFQQVKSNFYFQQVKSIFYFWQVPAKFPLVTSSACLEAVNQAIYSSTHFLSISPSSFSMMLLKHIISLIFCQFQSQV